MQSAKDSKSETTRSEILDGAAIANDIKREVARDVELFIAEHQVRPCLAAVRVGGA